MDNGGAERNCPTCDQVIKYISKASMAPALRNNTSCINCRAKAASNPIKTRECPLCKELISYTNEEDFQRGVKANRKCGNCQYQSKISVGDKFGYLTAQSFTGKGADIKWNCLCECGKTIQRSEFVLLNTDHPNRSCGCKGSDSSINKRSLVNWGHKLKKPTKAISKIEIPNDFPLGRKLMFVVYENNEPAIITGTKGWGNHRYDTFDEALVYAQKWLGDVVLLKEGWNGEAYDYSGYDDVIEIREEE